jgi:hypothetical protein
VAGIPTALDTYMLELINRGRMDPAAEATRYGCDLNEGIAPGTITTAPKQPLAFNPSLLYAAQGHSQWMLDNDKFAHQGAGGSAPSDRMVDAGYSFERTPSGAGENIGRKGISVPTFDEVVYTQDVHSGLYVDKDWPTRGHRVNLMQPEYKEVGVGVKTGVFTLSGADWNSVMVTEDFAYSAFQFGQVKSYLCGVAYADTVQADNFYTPGEGIGAVVIVATRLSDPLKGTKFQATTSASGAYSLLLLEGTYDVVATGGTLGGQITIAGLQIGAENVKKDFRPETAPANQPPTLTAVAPLTGANQDKDFTISYAALAAAADEADPNGGAVSFQVAGVTTGRLKKGGQDVAPGATILGPGESLVWHPAAGATGVQNAFTVKAWDGQLASADAVPVQINVTAAGTAKIEIKEGTNVITCGSTAPVAFGTVGLSVAAPEKTFRINNLGTAALAVAAPVLANNSGFEVSSAPAASVPAGGFTTFKIRMTTSAAGAKAADVSIATGDASANPFTFKVAGEVSGVPVQIEVRDGSTVLANNSGVPVAFGSVAQKSLGPERVFTIVNTGGQAMTVGRLTLENSLGFAVTQQPASSVPPGGSTTFRLQMATASPGAESADVKFTTNDSDDRTFRFKVAGTVLEQTVGIAATDATASEQGDDRGVFTLTRTGPAAAPLTVHYAVAGTASNRTDYIYIDGTVTFAPGSATATLEVLPIDDAAVEPAETVIVTLKEGTYGYAVDAAHASATVNLLDNEPTLSLMAQAASASEDTGRDGVFRITRSNTGVSPLTVKYKLAGTATNGGDYRKLWGTAVIPAGATYVDVVIDVWDDSYVEPAETAVMTLQSSTAWRLAANPATATVTIADNEPTVSIAATDPAGDEQGPHPITFTLTRSNVGDEDLRVYVKLTGTAKYPGDIADWSYPVIPAGQTSTTLVITPIDDTVVETSETVIMTLDDSSSTCGYVASAVQNSATGTIADNEPILGIAATDGALAEEGQTTGQFTITRHNVGTKPLTVMYEIGGTAVNGGDYFWTGWTGASGFPSTINGVATIDAGKTSTTIDLTAYDDMFQKGTETIVLTLKDAWWYTVNAAQKSATAAILDNEPTLSVVAWDATASEYGLDPGAFRIYRTNVGAKDLTVLYAIGGTAAWSVDYSMPKGQAVIPAGATYVDVTVQPIDDQVIEGNETVTLTLLANPATESFPDLRVNYSGPKRDRYLIAENSKTATVNLLDFEPTVGIVATDSAAAEGTPPNTGTFTVTRNRADAFDLVVDYAIGGTASAKDYNPWPTALTGHVTIPKNQTSATITITPIDDLEVEPAETVILTLKDSKSYHVNAAQESATVTIADNEPTISLTALDTTMSENGDTATVRFSRSNTNGVPLTVKCAVSGTASRDTQVLGGDGNWYVGDPPNAVVIPAGASYVDLVLTPYDDAGVEPQETLILDVTPGAGYTVSPTAKQVTVTIDDNEPVVSIAKIADGAEEGNAPGTFRVTSTRAVSYPLTISYIIGGTAANGADYLGGNNSLTTCVYLPAGATTLDFSIVPIDDKLGEGAETVVLTLVPDRFHTVNAGLKTATVTIADNEPAVGIVAADPSAAEQGPNPGLFRITRAVATPAPLSVGYTIGGTATNGVDYEKITSVATIPAGAVSVDIPINPVEDTLAEGDETILLTLKPNTALIMNAGATSATVTMAVPTTPETTGNKGVFRIARLAAGPAVDVNYTLGGAAANGTDYADLTGTATIPAGALYVDVDVTPVDDLLIEGDETVILTLKQSPTYSLNPAAKTATVTITDNEAEVSVAPGTPATVSEGGVATYFALTRSNTFAKGFAAAYTLSGKATNGTDYGKLSGLATFPDGSATVNVFVAPIQDTAIEGDETVIMTLKPTTAYTVKETAKTATVTILDDEPTLSVYATDAAAAEQGQDHGVFTIYRNNTGAEDLVVPYTLSGTATKGTDYSSLSGKATILAGRTSTTVDIIPVDDLLAEGNETVVLTLGSGTRYRLSTLAHDATVTIADNEPTVAVSATVANANEQGPTSGLFTVTRNNKGSTDLVVAYTLSGAAANGTDYVKLPGTVTIPANATAAVISVSAIDDQVCEGTETAVITLKPSTAYTVSASDEATVNVLDNEPAVSISAVNPNGSEAGPSPGRFRVTRSIVNASALTVSYTLGGTATNGTDYAKLGGTVTIPGGATYVDFNVQVIDDTKPEPTETVIATLAKSTAYTITAGAGTATVSIADNEPIVSVTASPASVGEASGGSATFTISRSVASAQPLTVSFTLGGKAAKGADYLSVPTSVTIPANQTSATVVIRPCNDTLIEVGNEEVELTLQAGSTFTLNPNAKHACITILDDEVWPDAFEADDSYSSAKPILVGASQNRTIHINDNLDWIRFTVTSQYLYYWFDITLSAGSAVRLSLFGSMYGMSQPMLGWEGIKYGPGLATTHYFAPVENGTYYLKIHEDGKNATVPAYTFTLRGTN